MKKQNKKKGASLIIVLMVLLIAMVLSTVTLTTISRTTKANGEEKRSEDLLYAAESGLQYGIAYFNSKKDNTSSIELDENILPNGFKINSHDTVVKINKISSGYEIISEAKQYERSRKVSVVIKKTSSEIKQIPTSIYGIDKIYLKRGVKGSIGTNSKNLGAITLDWGFRIDGEVYIPQGGNPDDIVKQPEWSGARPRIKQVTKVAEYPIPKFPDFPTGLQNKGNLKLEGNENNPPFIFNGINGNEYYENVTILNDRKLKINTVEGNNIIRIKNLNIDQGSIVINGPGKVLLYVDNCIRINGNEMNTSGNTKRFAVYCKSVQNNKLDIVGNTKVYASIYLNTSNITVGGSGQVFGDIITAGTEVKINGSSTAGEQIVYAPNAIVNIEGSAAFNGSLIGKEIYIYGGGGDVQLSAPIDPAFPIIVGSGSSSLQMGEVQYDS